MYKFKINDEIRVSGYKSTGRVTKIDSNGLPTQASIDGVLVEIIQDVFRVTKIIQQLTKLFSFFLKKIK